MKKLITWTLTLCMLFSALGICAAPALADDVYNVTIQWPTYGSSPEGLASVEEAINAITIPEIGCSLTLVPTNPFNLASETALAVSSGEKLDICLALFYGVSNLVDTGAIIPLDDLVEEYGADIKETCGIRLGGGYYDSELYAVPVVDRNANMWGYVARTDLLDKYGITIEDRTYSMEELGEIFATVKAGEGENFICIGGTNSNSELFQSMYTYDTLGGTVGSGVLMLDDDPTGLTVQNVFATEAYAKFADTMYDWAQKGFFPKDASTNTESGGSMIKAGNTLGYFPGTVADGAAGFTNQMGMDMTVIRTTNPWAMGRYMQSVLWCISCTSENPEKAMQFLNYIYKSEEVVNLLQRGIEGQDYVVLEKNEHGTLIDYPEGLSMTTVPYFCMFGIFGDSYKWYITAPNPITLNEEKKAFDENVENYSPAIGYTFITDRVSSQYSAVSSVISQYQAIISTGAIDPAQELPEFLKALEAAGIQKVIDENQRQLNDWAANQK